MRADQIISRLDPTAPIARGANMAFGSVADEVNFVVPLAVAPTRYAHGIKIASARLERNTVQSVLVRRARAFNDSLFV